MEDRTTRFGVDPFRGQPMQLWQGTILEGGGASLSRKLVISADCDLTDEKGGGEFFSLDILRAEDFAKQLVAGDARAELISILLQSARETARNRTPSFAEVSDDALFEWLTESADGRWESDLPSLHANERDWLIALKESIAKLIDGQAGTQSSSAEATGPAVLLNCANIQLSRQVDQLNKKIKSALLSRLQPSRVDLYILPALPGDSGTAGHVVPFKSLTLMARDQVCMRRVDLAKKPGGFVPRATCRPILLQSLLQKMMTYFVRIGLTNSFKSEQEAVVKTLVESMR